jgi:hypothetical protein
MKKRFEIDFLEEVLVFLRSLDIKHSEKILYNIGKAQIENNPELFKNSQKIFGNLERSIKVYNTDFLLFGTNPLQLKLW